MFSLSHNFSNAVRLSDSSEVNGITQSLRGDVVAAAILGAGLLRCARNDMARALLNQPEMSGWIFNFFGIVFISGAIWFSSRSALGWFLVRRQNRERSHISRRSAGFRFLVPLSLLGGTVFVLFFPREWIFGPISSVFVLLLGFLLNHATEKRQAAEWEEQSLVFLRTLLGLLRGGLSLPSALLQLSHRIPGRHSARLNRSLTHFLSGEENLAETLKYFRARSALGVTARAWEAVAIAYEKGISGSEVLERSLPLIEKELNLKRRIDTLRQGAIAQVAVAVVVPWGLLGLLFFSGQLPLAFFSNSPVIWGVGALCLGWQFLGGGLAWRLASFY